MSAGVTVRLSLSELRRRLDEETTARGRDALLRALRRDGRAGARTLLQGLERRMAAEDAERARLARLFARERALRAAGARFVAGVDEVGMGPLAGPVVAAAVVLCEGAELPGLDDSKRLDARKRERLSQQIRAQALAVGIGEAAPVEVDQVNILQASLRAMQRAVAGLSCRPDHVLVDARTIPDLDAPQTAIVGGDSREASIAAASIVAKVHRDALMGRLDAEHPGYGFAHNAGYATPAHLEALARLGPSPIHRRSFAPVAAWEERR